MSFQFNKEDPVISLHVKIKVGEKEIEPRLALDTGATYMMIPWKIAEFLELQPELSKEKVSIITASGIEIVPLVTLESVTVLGKAVENVEATVHDLPPRSYVDGLLGLSFLRNFNVNIRFKEGILEIE